MAQTTKSPPDMNAAKSTSNDTGSGDEVICGTFLRDMTIGILVVLVFFLILLIICLLRWFFVRIKAYAESLADACQDKEQISDECEQILTYMAWERLKAQWAVNELGYDPTQVSGMNEFSDVALTTDDETTISGIPSQGKILPLQGSTPNVTSCPSAGDGVNLPQLLQERWESTGTSSSGRWGKYPKIAKKPSQSPKYPSSFPSSSSCDSPFAGSERSNSLRDKIIFLIDQYPELMKIRKHCRKDILSFFGLQLGKPKLKSLKKKKSEARMSAISHDSSFTE